MDPVEEKDPEKNEVILCETVADAVEIVPIMLVNQVSKYKERGGGRKSFTSEYYTTSKAR